MSKRETQPEEQNAVATTSRNETSTEIVIREPGALVDYNVYYPEDGSEPVYVRKGTFGKGRDWVIDSGAGGHCTNTREWLENPRMVPRTYVQCANGEVLYGEVMGDVNIDGNGLIAKNVLYLPNVDANLISVRCLANDDNVIVFNKHGCAIYDSDGFKVEGNIKAKGEIIDQGLYRLIPRVEEDARPPPSTDLLLWHRRMGHMDLNDLILLRDVMATGIYFDYGKLECPNKACAANLQIPRPIPRYSPRAIKPLQIVYMHIGGPMPSTSLSGNRFYLTCIDDYTRKTFVYLFKNVNKYITNLQKFIYQVQTKWNRSIDTVLMTFGIRYLNSLTYKYLEQNRITYKFAYDHDSVVVQAHQNLVNKMSILLQDAKLPNLYWGEALQAAAALINRSPNPAVRNKTPEEAWTGRKPDLSAIKLFGCIAFSPSLKEPVVYTGYNYATCEHRVVNPDSCGSYYKTWLEFYENIPYSEYTKKRKHTPRGRF